MIVNTKRVIKITKKTKDVHQYVLGGTPEVYITPKDQDGIFFVPSESRISIKEPDGDIYTVSGGDMILASGYLYILYRPLTKGGYATETWVKDSTGREDTDIGFFEVVDYVYYD